MDPDQNSDPRKPVSGLFPLNKYQYNNQNNYQPNIIYNKPVPYTNCVNFSVQTNVRNRTYLAGNSDPDPTNNSDPNPPTWW